MECVKGGDVSRGGGVVESPSGVGMVLQDNLLRENVHYLYVSIRGRRQLVLWRSIGVRMVLCRGCGVRTARLGVCSVGMWRCDLDGVGLLGEACYVGDGET